MRYYYFSYSFRSPHMGYGVFIKGKVISGEDPTCIFELLKKWEDKPLADYNCYSVISWQEIPKGTFEDLEKLI